MLTRVAGLLLICLLPLTRSSAQAVGNDTPGYIRTQLQLSDDEFSALRTGKPVVKTLSAAITREMITIGGHSHRGLGHGGFVEQFKTLEGFRTSQFVMQILRFSAEPDLRDLDLLVLDAGGHRRHFDKCRVGDCDVQLSAEDIRRFNTQVDWRSPDADAQATALYKSVLFAHLARLPRRRRHQARALQRSRGAEEPGGRRRRRCSPHGRRCSIRPRPSSATCATIRPSVGHGRAGLLLLVEGGLRLQAGDRDEPRQHPHRRRGRGADRDDPDLCEPLHGRLGGGQCADS